MLFLYDLVLFIALLIIFPYLLPKVLLGGHGLKERLGLWPRTFFQRMGSEPILWLHAASVGEVHSLAAFLPALRRRAPHYQLILSVTSRAGRERAIHLGEDICRVFYLPVDLSFLVKRVLRMVNPKVLLLAETELWPNLILQARRRGAKVALINGRMSARSFSRYRLFRGLMCRVLSSLELLCIQTEEDARRFRALGANPRAMKVLGNIKADLLATRQMRGEREQVRQALGIAPETHLLVAGSTRPGEEEEIATAILGLRTENGSFRAIVAPRHVKRARKVMRLLQGKGLRVKRYSLLESSSTERWEVLLVDTLGQLMRLYAAADVAFVGGSLLPYGGHNPLEPASYAIPVFFGPHMEHCRRSAHSLLRAGGAIQVEDGMQLKEMASRLFVSGEERHRRGQAALQVVREGGGISERMAQALKETVL
jgi:3-deoxy-D-manno-octulosonic-acid transferase